MATKKQKAIIIAMAAMAATTTENMRDAAAIALRDIKKDVGANETFFAQSDPFDLSYDWDPSDGDCA